MLTAITYLCLRGNVLKRININNILLLGVVIVLASLYSLANLVPSCSESIKQVAVKVDTSDNIQTYSVDQLNSFIAISVDSVNKYYKNHPVVISKIKVKPVNVDSVFNEAKLYWQNKIQLDSSAQLGNNLYESGFDSTFVALDDSGRVTDSINVQVKYLSRLPPHPSNLFAFRMRHKSFNYNTTTIITDPANGFYAGIGYGVINNKFDLFFGYGYKIKFDLIKTIGGLF